MIRKINFDRIIKYSQDFLLFSGGNLFAQFIMMVYALLVARNLGPSQLGIYTGLYAIGGLSVTIVNWGLDTWILRESAKEQPIQILTGKVLSIKIALGFVWGIILIIVLPLIKPEQFPVYFVLIVILDIFFDILFNTHVASWNIQKKIKQLTLMLIISRLGKFLLLVLLTLLNQINPINIATSRLFISVIVLLVGFFNIKPVINFSNIIELKNIIKRSFEFSFSEVLAVIYANVDVTLLTFLAVSKTVGLYSPASGIIHALFIIPNSYYSLLLPRLSKKIHQEKDSKNLNNEIKMMILLFLGIGLVTSLGLYIGGEYVVGTLLGEKYMISGKILAVLSPIMLFKSLEFGLAVIIVIFGYQKMRLVPQFVAAFVSIFANIWLIPIHGIWGVSWVYIISELLLLIGYLIIVYKIYSIRKQNAKS